VEGVAERVVELSLNRRIGRNTENDDMTPRQHPNLNKSSKTLGKNKKKRKKNKSFIDHFDAPPTIRIKDDSRDEG
ncbi:unnamed protein product, partial [Citrullus colocynthis]